MVPRKAVLTGGFGRALANDRGVGRALASLSLYGQASARLTITQRRSVSDTAEHSKIRQRTNLV